MESHTGSHPPGFPGYSHTHFSLLTRKNCGMAVTAEPSPFVFLGVGVLRFVIQFSMCVTPQVCFRSFVAVSNNYIKVFLRGVVECVPIGNSGNSFLS